MKRMVLGVALIAGIACTADAALMVRELWEGVGNGTINGTGDGATSLGFEPGSTWFQNAGSIEVAANFNLVNTPDNIPGLPASWGGLGGLWFNASSWNTGAWATRQLAAEAQVDFTADDVIYMAVRLNNAGDSALGMGLASGGDSTAGFLGAGFHWNNATGLDGQNSANSLYLTGGTLDQDLEGNNDGPYAILAHTAAGVVNGKALLLCRLTTSSTGNDTLAAELYLPGTTVPVNPATIAWDVSYSTNLSMLATHLLVWLNGDGTEELDAIRIGRTFIDVVGLEAGSVPAIAPAATVYAGTPVTISIAEAGGYGTPLYCQWYKNDVAINGATNTTLNFASAATGDSGAYYAALSNIYGTAQSGTATLTVNPASAPIITAEPQSGTRFTGGRATFTVTVDGSPTFGYLWQKDEVDIPGANAAALTLTDLTGADQAGYRVIVTNFVGATTSAVANLAVVTPLVGTYEEAIVTNRPVAYWRMNEELGDIAYDWMGGYDATHTSVIYPLVGPAPDSLPLAFLGFEYSNYAVQYDGYTSDSSTTASLLNNRSNFTIMGWVNSQGEQGLDPNDAGRTGLFGQNDLAEFGFHGSTNIAIWVAGGGGTVGFHESLMSDYEWHFLAAVASGTNLSIYLDGNLMAQGGGSSTNYGSSAYPFRIGGGGILDATGNFFNGLVDEVAVFDRALTITEINDFYSVARGSAVPPSITSFPTSLERYEGLDIRLTVVASGTLPMVYQWQKDGANLTNGGQISGAQSATLVVSNTVAGDAAGYRVLISNGSGETVTSDVATVTLRAPAGGSYEQAIVSAGPLAYWRLNETGDTAFDYVGGYDATHTSVTLPVDGPRPTSTPFAFDGFETTNDAGLYDGTASGSSTTASLANNRSSMTAIGWINLANTQLVSRVGFFGQNDAFEFGFHGLTAIGLWTPGGGYVTFSPSLVNTGEWACVAAVCTGTNIILYLNGEQVGIGGNVTNNYGASSDPFRFGGGGILDATGNPLNGAVDEVAFFDRALSGSEINLLYAIARAGSLPAITAMPYSMTRYVTRDATFRVGAGGVPPLYYQWQFNGSDLSDGLGIAGAQTEALTVAYPASTNVGTYRVIVSNAGGAVTSDVVTLTLLVPPDFGGEAAVVAYDPVAYWRLNETGGTMAFDAWGGFDGAYGEASVQGVAGARPPEVYGFETNNVAAQSVNAVADSYVTVPALNLYTNTVTITCWLYADGDQGGWRGLVYNRAGATVAGLHFGGTNSLHYTWNDNLPDTYNWDSALYVPTNQWTFAALVVRPDDATIYMGDGRGALQSAVHVFSHTNEEFNAQTLIGGDSQDTAARAFNGVMDEVAIFNRALSYSEIRDIYDQSIGVVYLDIDPLTGGVVVTWPMGILQSAPTADGTYTDMPGATSPYTNAPTADKQFFRARQP